MIKYNIDRLQIIAIEHKHFFVIWTNCKILTTQAQARQKIFILIEIRLEKHASNESHLLSILRRIQHQLVLTRSRL